MAKVKKRELYNFTIDIEEETEREVTKEIERKNDEGEKEIVKQVSKEKVIEQVPVKVFLKKPTRSQVEDGDMFYSIWLNKFIKMGLLTRAMLAKKQLDVGGTLNEEDKLNYAKLYLKLFEKQQNVIRYSAMDADKMSNDEKERLDKAVSELSVIRKDLADFEAAQASIFDHTADVKARNKTITWFLLHMAYYVKGDKDDAEELPLFPGTDYEEKYDSYQELDEDQDPIFTKTIDKLSTIATIWYMSGLQEQKEFDDVLNQMNKDSEQNLNVEEVLNEAVEDQVKKDQPKKAQPKKEQPKQEQPQKQQPKQGKAKEQQAEAES
jgi:hypothetical protein|tara:strand:- start:11401 stop:12366 length:966 start_codon:yes stop_codon:yes gene_type:complete